VDEESRFGERIQASLPPDIDVINMGMWGYSTGQELLVLREMGLAYQPDVVVLSLFLDDLYCSRLFSVNDGMYIKPRYKLGTDGTLTLQNVPVPVNHGPSRFWNFLVTRYSDLRNRRAVGDAWRLGWFAVFDKAYAGEKGFSLSLALLGQIHDTCSSAGIDFVVVIIPYKDQLAGRSSLGIPPERFDLLLPQKVVKAYLRKRGVTHVDLLPIMREQPDPGGLYFEKDLHWTPRGHEVAAEAVLEELQAMGGVQVGP
jgi:hypothetical protein